MVLSLAVAALGCTEERSAVERIGAGEGEGAETSGGSAPATDEQTAVLARELFHATWPDDLADVEIYSGDAGLVIVVLDGDGRQIGRVIARELDGAPGIFDLSTEFADGSSWATMDLTNDTLVQYGSDGLDGETIAGRAAMIGDHVKVNPPEGPWLDCVLGILDAVFSCIPGVGVLHVCPKAIKSAVCTCAKAAKKKAKACE